MTDNCVIERTPENGTQTVERTSCDAFRPNVDILEGADEFIVRADLPGATAKDVNIEFEKGVLTLHARVARRERGGANQRVQEYGVGDYAREFRIGEGIDTARAAAEVANGVLTLHLPKAEAAKPRRIEVK